MLYFHRPGLTAIRQLLTQVAYTLPFSFNKNPFPVRMGRYSRIFFQAGLTLAVTAESHPPSVSNISPAPLKLRPYGAIEIRLLLLLLLYPITNIQMQVSIKPICDWTIYLTASTDERLSCITQTSFHSTTLFMWSVFVVMTLDQCEWGFRSAIPDVR